ncbi:MAG: hypothetical protein AB8D52_05445 [Gammaproteobacteria bacterium]
MIKIRLIILLLISSVFVTNANGFDLFDFEIEEADFSGWKFSNLYFQFDISADRSSTNVPELLISIDQIKSTTGINLKQVIINCPVPTLQTFLQFKKTECKSGNFSAKHPQLGKVKGKIDFLFDQESDLLEASIKNLQVAKGRLDVDLKLKDESWEIDLKGKSIDVAALKNIAILFVELPEITSDETGHINLNLIANGRDTNLQFANISLRTYDLGFDGNSVAEDLDASLDISVEKKGAEYHFKETLKLIDGAIYIEPGFTVGAVSPGFLFSPESQPISLSSNGIWQEDKIKIHSLLFDHPDVVTIKTNGTIRTKKETSEDSSIENLALELNTHELHTVFPIYIQPLLFGSGLDGLEIVGETNLQLKLAASGITDFHIILQDVFVEDKASRFHIAGLDGDIHLNSDPNVKDSEMQWQGGSIYKMNIGASKMKLSSKGRSMSLRQKMVIPIFDGALHVDKLEMKELGLTDYSVHINSKLTPITFSEFTEALGWPLMAGNISGEIPGISYHGGDLTSEGQLRINVFDGDILISKLRIEDLFDLIPTLYADLSVENLDLGILTKTFEFGDITGKLSGYMRDMRLDTWQPVKFDANFRTPENDKSRHRISQRAIDNLTSIGGGGGANAISRGVLGVFEDFPYSKLGLSCKLIDSICYMDGVEKTENGYYIVKRGFFPPWLNIKGFNHEVDWLELLERLKNISKADSPIIE